MTYQRFRKNTIRLIVREYHEKVEDTLKNFPNSYSKYEFSRELEIMANGMKEENKTSDHINSIRKSLKGIRKEMIKSAKQSLASGKVSKDLFFTNYYGGIPLDNRSDNEELYDKVIEYEQDSTEAWIFCMSANDEVNYAQIQSEVEHDFGGKKCTRVVEKYPINVEDVPTKDFENNKETEAPEDIPDDNDSENDTPTDASDDGWISTREKIGKVYWNKKNCLKLPEERDKWHFTVLIQDHFANEMWPNRTVAVSGKVKDETTPIPTYKRITFFAKLGDGEKNSRHTAEDFNSYEYLHTEFKAYPLKQKISNSKLVEFNVSDLSGFKVGKVTDEEILLLYGMKPDSGIPYGNVVSNDRKVTARFPYSATDTALNTTFSQSKNFIGRMGVGKTSLLKWDFLTTATTPIIPERERPIFIFIDGNNNFTRFPRIENLNDEAREYCETHQLTNPRLDVLTFSNNVNLGDTTLGLDQLQVESWKYMFAQAAANTESIFLTEATMARETILGQGLEVNITNIRREMENRVNANRGIHASIRGAISRMLSSPETNLFDQQNRTVLTPELLFQLGRSLTLDVSNLNYDDRRTVVAYVAEMLHYWKFVRRRHYPHVILVLDEAEQIVPRRGTDRERYHIKRLSGRLAEITENGRQHFYGMYFVTHKTSKVDNELVSLAGTQICFKPTADDKAFIEKYIPEVPFDEILKLNVGEFWMKHFTSTIEQQEIVAKCKFPDFSEVEDNPL